MAGVAGIEPTHKVLETLVLPLNNTPIYSFFRMNMFFNMAGVTGLEPITGGFEDRSSTIELHPYIYLIYYK